MPGVAWAADGSYMTVTDPKTLAKMRKSELSASRSFDLDPGTCSVNLVKGVVLPREDDIFEDNQLGTGAHAVLEALFQLPAEERTQERALAIMESLHDDPEFAADLLDANYVEQLKNLSKVDLIRWYDEIKRRVLGLWKIEDPTKVTVHSTEMSFGKRHGLEVKIGRVPFVGFIDRVDQILDLNTGEVIGYNVIDYKAGKYKEGNQYGDDYADQVRLYVEAVKAAEGIEPSSGSLFFITYGKPRPIDISPDKVEGTIRRFERAWDRMHKLADENKYPTKPGPLCGWCELVNACPAAIKARKTDLSNTEKVNGKRVVVPGKKKKGLDRVLLGIPTIGQPGTSAPAVWDADGNPQPGETATPVTPAAAAVAPAVPAAHRPTDTTERTIPPMTATATTALIVSGSTTEPFIDGSLNAASPTSKAVVDVSAFAVEQLTAAGLDVNGANVNALAFTFAQLIETVERQMSGGTFEWNSRTNLLVRSAFSTAVETYPLPWGGSGDDFEKWTQSIVRRTRAILSVGRKLADPASPRPEQPWAALVGQTPTVKQEGAAA